MFDKNIDHEKQHINLSDAAWLVIEDDIRNFYTYEDKETFSGFMNTIFINYHEDADASLSSRREEYRSKLDDILFDGNKHTEEIKQKLLRNYVLELKEKAFSYPKGEGRKFRLNVKSQELLTNHPDGKEYNHMRGDYLKAIYEQYATLPTYIREQIFFKDTINDINNAIVIGKKIRISLLSKTNQTSEISQLKFLVKPYTIRQDKTKTFNYLIGYSLRLNENNEPISNERISCFRISRIDSIKLVSTSFISKEKKLEIEKTIKEKGVQFMAGELADITVTFTIKGFDDFNRQSYMRPQFYDKVDKNTYIFHCTEFQAISYFFKFGMDAQIIEPIELRNKMKSRYETALNAYSEQ